MPGNDKTGPLGRGPLTGRGLGPCGRGLAMRRGFGRGLGWRYAYAHTEYPQPLSREDEKKVLEAEKAEIEQELKSINDKLNEMQ